MGAILKILNEKEVKSIEIFFQLKEDTLLKTMHEFLKKHYKTIHLTKEFLIAVGELPVALVAHVDTVFTYPPEDVYYDRVKNVMWSPDGLGADDRAGVYAITQIVKSGYRPTIIFTTDEEIGGLGARALIDSYKEAPTDLKYIIQVDRRGSNDCVFYNCGNTEFEKYVEGFGFVTSIGSFSDISIICPAWGIAGVNLSIGYYDEHSRSEILHIGQMLSTIQKIKHMLDASHTASTYEYIHKPYSYSWMSNAGVSSALKQYLQENSHRIENNPLDYGYGWSDDVYVLKECPICQQTDYEYNMYPVKTDDYRTVYVCIDCISASELGWCDCCGEAYYYTKDSEYMVANHALCKDCQIKVRKDGLVSNEVATKLLNK